MEECTKKKMMADQKGNDMKKRYRDNNGQLTISLAELKKATKDEASTYFQIGGIYLSASENDEYVYTEKDEQLAHFQSFSGKNLFIPVDSLGTYLPDVASVGMELVLVEI